MERRTRYLLMAALLAVFLFGAYGAWSVHADREAGRAAYEGAAAEYSVPVPAAAARPAEAELDDLPYDGPEPVYAPVRIDFDKLAADCPDIRGWIYCEDTGIDYPVVQGTDDRFYLKHTYLGDYASAGAIFLEAANEPGFSDLNNVVFGHHMKDGTMFAGLSDWASQEYYDAHPVMWLLTPEQDYMVELFSGYVTPAGSKAYAIYREPGEKFDHYLETALAASDFAAGPDFVLDGDARYILLSTCNYTYSNARYVLHGKLVPVLRMESGDG